MLLSDRLDDRQPETAAARPKFPSGLQSLEWPERKLHLVGRDARAPIADLDGHLGRAAVQGDVDGFALAILPGVLHKVGEDSLQRYRIGEEDAWRIFSLQTQLDSFPFKVACERLDHFPQVDLHEVSLFRSARELQELGNQAIHGIEVATNALYEFRSCLFVKHLNRDRQPRQGRSQVMGNPRDHYRTVFRHFIDVRRQSVDRSGQFCNFLRTGFVDGRGFLTETNLAHGLRQPVERLHDAADFEQADQDREYRAADDDCGQRQRRIGAKPLAIES